MTDDIPNSTAPDPEEGSPAPDPGPGPTAPDPVTSRPGRAVSSAETRPRRPDYRGEELDPERGPGLGCFWFQVIVLGFFIVLIPIGLELNWPFELLAFLLFVVIGLLLLTGQSVIFLLRLVAADRRSQGRRRPLASSTKTVGELADEEPAVPAADERPGGAAAAMDAARAGDTQLPEPRQESSPDRQEAGLTGPGDADESVARAEVVESTGPTVSTEGAAAGANDGAPPPDDASPEEPGAGVRQ